MQALAKNKIIAELSPDNQKRLGSLHVLSKINSTNTYLLQQAKTKSLTENEKKTVEVCVAEEQTEGRGRQGKPWYSPKGRNIYCSLAFHLAKPVTYISQLSLAVAVIVIDSCKRYGVEQLFQLKWPNDLYYNNRKLGGILIESVIAHLGGSTIVIGIGLNISLPPKHPFLATSIDLQTILSKPVDRNKLIGILIDEMLFKIPYFFAHGFQTFLSKWQEHDMLQNKFVVIKQNDAEIAGFAQGINEQGELLVRDPQGRVQTFRCGDVSVVLKE